MNEEMRYYGGSRPHTVLVVDDEPAVQRMVSRRLQANGYDVIVAAGGEEALALAEARRPDVIVMDIMMPGMTGDQVAERLKENDRTKAIPVVFLTCLVTRNESEAADGLIGENRMLGKPIDSEMLVGTVRRLLA